jgi:hypothetical protein
MAMSVNFRLNSHNLHSRKSLLSVVFLLFVLVLSSSGFISAFNGASFFVLGASKKIVSTETELINAFNTAEPIIVALDNDIQLTFSLYIVENMDVTLTSNKANGFYKLIGAYNFNTITVREGGVLRLDGIIVTHATDALCCGVIVDAGGKLVMSDGEISGNYGRMSGDFYGGVSVYGSFIMSGGKISNNIAYFSGGGVFVNRGGSFTMSGGTITGNKVGYDDFNGWKYGTGGGVRVDSGSSFKMSGGTITGNTAELGGGVYVNTGSFSMTGGTISGNTGGNIYNPYDNSGSSNSGLSDDTDRVFSYDGHDDSIESSDGFSNGNNGLSDVGNSFSLRDVIVICVSVIVIAVGVVVAVMFVYFQKKVNDVEEKLSRHIDG